MRELTSLETETVVGGQPIIIHSEASAQPIIIHEDTSAQPIIIH